METRICPTCGEQCVGVENCAPAFALLQICEVATGPEHFWCCPILNAVLSLQTLANAAVSTMPDIEVEPEQQMSAVERALAAADQAGN